MIELLKVQKDKRALKFAKRRVSKCVFIMTDRLLTSFTSLGLTDELRRSAKRCRSCCNK